MDSSSSFLNLLNSQQPNQILNHTQNESDSPSIGVGSSEVPIRRGSSKERRKWTPKEDVLLISGWLNTSKDPVIGNEQKAGAFWKRIQAYFNSSAQLVGLESREWSHCKQRWGRLNDQVCKFVGCYEAALKEQSSGQNDNDVMKAANKIFFNDNGAKFTLEHAWRELRHDQKWCSTSFAKDGGRSKRRKLDDASAQSSCSQPVSHGEAESMGRPPGVKAAKGKAKRNASKTATVEEDGKSLLEFQNMWAIKKENDAMKLELCKEKQFLNKQKLLDSLLCKAEPLSEEEVALKNKLIAEMLS